MPKTQTPDPQVDSQEKEIDLSELGEEELSKVEINEEGKVVRKAEEVPAPSPEDGGEVPPKEEAKKDKQLSDEEIPAEETDQEKEPDEIESFLVEMQTLRKKSEKEGTDEYSKRLETLKETDPVRAKLWEVSNRVSGLQKGFQEERTLRRAVEKRYKKSRVDHRKAELDSFQEISDDELKVLKEDDPELYAEYLVQKTQHEAKKAEFDKQQVTEQQEAQTDELGDFLFSRFGIDLAKTTQAELDQVFSEEVSTRVDAMLNKLFGENVLYTAEQIGLVYDHVMKPELLKQARMQARESLKESITTVEPNRSRLNSLPRNTTTRKFIKPKEEITVEEIRDMGEKEFEEWAANA